MKKENTKRVCRTLTVTLPDGQRKRLYFYGATEKEAAAKVEEAKFLQKNGLLTVNNNTPLRKWAEDYFDLYIYPNYTTFNADSLWGLLDRTVLTDYGYMSLDKIKPNMLKSAVNKIKNQSKSQNDKLFQILRGLFRTAKANGYIINDPMDSVKKEKRKSNTRRALTNKEREIFEKTLKTHAYAPLFALMYYCGLRPGEARAMTWNQIHFKTQTLQVCQSVKKTKDSTNKGIQLGSPKTEAGVRTIPMPQALIDILSPIAKKGFGYVVESRPGQPISEQRYKHAWQSFFRNMQIAAGATLYRNRIIVAAQDIGTDLTPYCLRHTYATRLAEKRVDIKVAMKFMGHTSANMLMQVYQHVSEKLEDEARIIVRDLYAPSTEEQSLTSHIGY